MINLSRYFGAFICAVQMAVLTGVSFSFLNFINSWFAVVVLAAFVGAMLVGATQFFDRILGFTPLERVWWVSFVLLPASFVLWVVYTTFKTIGQNLSDLQSVGGAGANSALLSTYGSGTTGLHTPIIFQLGLLVGAYVLLLPSVKDGLVKRAWLFLPTVVVVMSIFFGIGFAATIGW